jgi:small-conductance mechanosensitive channel
MRVPEISGGHKQHQQENGQKMESTILNAWADWGWTLVIVVAAVAVALVVHHVFFTLFERVVRRTNKPMATSMLRYSHQPAKALFAILALFLVLPSLPIPIELKSSLERFLALTFTGAMGWLAFKLTWVLTDVVAAKHDVTATDNLLAREVMTRIGVLQRILATLIVVITVCLILMSIPSIRQIGVTLFASAGIAGIVAGLAARPALTNLIAGIQLALTQPVRIDDVVIVEGEWGWIEEIRVTFVVVRIWDLRRLVVPLSYFIEHPFQNWTRKKADILGTVFLYVDYTVPVQRVREELHRILQADALWDGEVWGLQVTDATDRAVELRALMGARNSGDAWNLRCHVREQLIDFLQREYPGSLPRLRAELPQKLEKIADTVPERAMPAARGLGDAEGATDQTLADPRTRQDA